MPDSDSALLNIQENLKTYEKEVALLRRWLKDPTLLGQVLRVLVRRLKCSYSREPYAPLELQVLLLLSLAEIEPPTASNAAGQAGRL